MPNPPVTRRKMTSEGRARASEAGCCKMEALQARGLWALQDRESESIVSSSPACWVLWMSTRRLRECSGYKDWNLHTHDVKLCIEHMQILEPFVNLKTKKVEQGIF